MAVRHKDAQRNIRIDRFDPRFSETALREYYRQLHRMPTEMQQEYRQENAPAKPQWQPTELPVSYTHLDVYTRQIMY